MQVNASNFLEKVKDIYNEKPTYRKGGMAKDGTCDCIGLIMGALDRCGYKWKGTHGSNWTARNALRAAPFTNYIWNKEMLKPGDLVFKAYKPTDSGWALPVTYENHKDQNDYYHVGVVVSVTPLKIYHCTTPTVKIDTKIGKWEYFGECKYISYEENEPVKEETPMETVTTAKVTLNSGYLRIREGKGTTFKMLGKIDNGEMVNVLKMDDESGWYRIEYQGTVGYVKASYLTPCETAQIVSAEPAVLHTTSLLFAAMFNPDTNSVDLVDNNGNTLLSAALQKD